MNLPFVVAIVAAFSGIIIGVLGVLVASTVVGITLGTGLGLFIGLDGFAIMNTIVLCSLVSQYLGVNMYFNTL